MVRYNEVVQNLVSIRIGREFHLPNMCLHSFEFKHNKNKYKIKKKKSSNHTAHGLGLHKSVDPGRQPSDPKPVPTYPGGHIHDGK